MQVLMMDFSKINDVEFEMNDDGGTCFGLADFVFIEGFSFTLKSTKGVKPIN